MTFPDNSLFCCYCGIKFDPFNRRKHKTVDHIIPVSKGGANTPYNKRNCCNFCNTQKSNLLLQDFLLRIEGKDLSDYETNIRIENIKYLIDYVNSAGEKVFKNKGYFKWYKRRYLKLDLV